MTSRSLILPLLSTLFATKLSPGSPDANCMDHAETQLEMTSCASQDYKAADARMNALYRELMNGKHSSKFKAALRASQRAWLGYRDSVIRVYFPDPNEQYGSVQPMCESQLLADLTNARLKELTALLKRVEGDVCGPNDN